MEITRVRNETIWRQLRIVFIASALLFGINIYFGFANTVTVGDLPRSQLLIHLHAGSIGWITLSVIGFSIWVVTGDRGVSRGYERAVTALTWAAILVFAGYIPNFWLAFIPGDAAVTFLLPIFGSAAVLVLWSTAIFVLVQLRRQARLTNVQLLAGGALLVAAIGATVGALLGMERLIGQFLPLPETDRNGAHAGAMDTYLFLAATAAIEWMVVPAAAQRLTRSGVVHAVAWTLGGAMVPVAMFLALDALFPVFGVLLLAGLVLFLVRVGWRALRIGPRSSGVQPWAFFGTVWLLAFIGLFVGGIVMLSSGGETPSWFGVAFVHAGFVGMMTNLLLGAHAARAWEARRLLSWADPIAQWLITVGVAIFVLGVLFVESRLGAIVMGTGVLLGVATMVVRLVAIGSTERARAQPRPGAAAGEQGDAQARSRAG